MEELPPRETRVKLPDGTVGEVLYGTEDDMVAIYVRHQGIVMAPLEDLEEA